MPRVPTRKTSTLRVPEPETWRPIRVLVIDDNEDDYLILESLLSEAKTATYELTWETDYGRALEQAQAHTHDMYLIDYRLGLHDGIEWLHEAISLGCRAPIIMLTGKGDQRIDLQAMRGGAADFLLKTSLTAEQVERSLRYAYRQTQMHRVLTESEEKYRAMFEQAPFGIAQIARDGRILQANQAFCQIGGYDAGTLDDVSCFALLDAKGGFALESLTRLLSNQQHFGPLEASFFHKDSERIVPLRLSGAKFESLESEERAWLFIEDVSRQQNLQEKLLQAGQIQAVGDLASHVSQELETYLTAIRGKTEQILRHERGALSPGGVQELEVVIEQCHSLQRFLGPFFSREKEKVVARQALSRVLSALRLRILRERGGRTLRTFLHSADGRVQVERVLSQAVRTGSEAEGMAIIHTWLLQQEPPLLPAHKAGALWSRLQPVFQNALQALQASDHGALYSEAGGSRARITPAPRQYTLAPVRLPPALKESMAHTLQHFEALQLSRWLPTDRFQAMVERWLQKAQRNKETELQLEPLWEELQRVPDLDPFLLAHFFRQITRRNPSFVMRLPPLLVVSSVYEGQEQVLGHTPGRSDWDNWRLLTLPLRWREAVVEIVDRFLFAKLFDWSDPIAFERFLEQRLAWFLCDDILDLTSIRAYLREESIPPQAYGPFLASLEQGDFPWSVVMSSTTA